MFFTVDAEVGFDIRVNYTGKGPGVVGIISDYGPNFGVGTSGYLNAGLYDDKGENGAKYEGLVNFIGGPNYNNNVPDDGKIIIDSITVLVQNPGTIHLAALYMGIRLPMMYLLSSPPLLPRIRRRVRTQR